MSFALDKATHGATPVFALGLLVLVTVLLFGFPALVVKVLVFISAFTVLSFVCK